MKLFNSKPTAWITGSLLLTALLSGWHFSSTPSSPASGPEQHPLASAAISEPAAPESAASPLTTSAPPDVTPPTPVREPKIVAYTFKGAPQGQALPPKAPAVREGAEKGRVMEMAALSPKELAGWVAGQEVHLPTPDGELTGIVNLVQKDEGGWVRVGGSLPGKGGSFTLSASPTASGGLLMLPPQGLAFEIATEPDGRVLLVERRLADKLCFVLEPLAQKMRKLSAAASASTASAPPLKSSRPTAPAVVYIDFDGKTITAPDWNNGQPIVASRIPLTVDEMTEIFNRVAEDFSPFNIDITTDVSRYNAVPANRRTRCIVTSNDAAAPGAGGVAYIDAFSTAGSNFSSTVPCWVFNDSVIGIAEAISHEVGHTLGLSHDGRSSPNEAYYAGHGTGATGWAPIMGVGYDKLLVQWSKGEYKNANNKEDDLAMISRAANGFGYIQDEAGNSIATAAPLIVSAGSINQTGVITGNGDGDYFQFTSLGGTITVSASPAAVSPDLDILLELRDSAGNLVIPAVNPANLTSASIPTTSLPAGTFYLRVAGAGQGDPLTTGYTSYGSVGSYTLTGTIAGIATVPAITSSATSSGKVGESFSYQITATNSPTSYGLNSTLPSGLSFAASGLISGTPTVSGTFPLTITATNSQGTGSLQLTLTISQATISLVDALDLTGVSINTSGNADWTAQTSVTFDSVDAAASGHIMDNQSSSMTMSVTGPAKLMFRWKVDSEPGYDKLNFVLDGTTTESISGATDWALRTIDIPLGTHQVEWRYSKDSSISIGSDTGWVDTVSVAAPNAQRLAGDLSFGRISTSSSATRTFTIFNDSAVSINVTGITYPSGFSGAWSGSIQAGGSQTVTVTFAPTTAQIFSGIITVDSDAPTGTRTLPISGEGFEDTTITPLVKNVALTDLSAARDSMKFYKITVPLGTASLKVATTGGTGDLDLYLKKDAMPSPGMFDFKSDGTTATESITVTNPEAGDWFVLLYAYIDYAGVTLTPTVTANATNYAVSVSASGMGTASGGGNFAANSTVTVRATPASGASFLNWTENGTIVSTSAAYSFTLTSTRALVANFSTTLVLTNNVQLNNVSGALNSQVVYKVVVPSGISRLTITSSGGNGDVDLYLKRGSTPTSISFDQKSAHNGNTETLSIFSPSAGDWYVLLRGYRAYSGVRLKAVLTPAGSRIDSDHPADPVLAQMAGSYTGLLGDGSISLLGKMRFQLTQTGAFSCASNLDGRAYSFSGKFDSAGIWKGSIRAYGMLMPLALALDLEGKETITGSLSWDGITYPMIASKESTGAPDQAGVYPVTLVPVDTEDVDGGLPQTAGSALFTVKKDGNIVFVATLGDGTRFTTSGMLEADGRWAMYVPLYKGTGAIGGWWQFQPWKTGMRAKASLLWFQPPGTPKSEYPAGFNGVLIGDGSF